LFHSAIFSNGIARVSSVDVSLCLFPVDALSLAMAGWFICRVTHRMEMLTWKRGLGHVERFSRPQFIEVNPALCKGAESKAPDKR
jgi:hypothetical protein